MGGRGVSGVPEYRSVAAPAAGSLPVWRSCSGLAKLAASDLVDSIPHHLNSLGPPPRRRHFPTEKGIEAAARVEHCTERFLSEYPVSREWFRLLTECLDSVAVLNHVAAVIAHADPGATPGWWTS